MLSALIPLPLARLNSIRPSKLKGTLAAAAAIIDCEAEMK
jgi:hypothetical protein